MSSKNNFSPTLRHLCALALALILTRPLHAQLCNGSGNVVVFSNYDGSGNTAATRLNINVDVNIPNLKIGIASYERVTVNIAGTFVSNVTAVRWAGYGGTNNHCTSTAATVITGVPAGIITYVNNPPATVADPQGNASIIGGYACTAPNGTGNGGGSASMYQIVNYFLSAFGPGSTLRSAFSQYGCWAGTTKALSATASGNCCPLVSVLPVELIAFDHQCQGDQLALHWSTAAELNNGSFTIERSRDGIAYQAVAEIAGAGDAEAVRDYHWTDPSPATERAYYRLSQTDINGQTQQLNTIAASPCRQDPAADLQALGSPAEGSLLLQYTRREAGDEDVQLSLLDPLGHVARARQQHASTGNNVFFVDVAGLASGVYVVQLRTATRALYRKVVLP
jgi:hypothetical protein